MNDFFISVNRLKFDRASGALVEVPRTIPFVRGPIPLMWLSRAAKIQGKALNVAVALWWLQGMARGKPFKLTQKALKYLNVSRYAAGDGLARLEREGLLRVERKAGQRPTISILDPQIKPGGAIPNCD